MALWMVFVVASIVVGNLAGTHKAENSGNVGETARAEQMIKDGNFPKDPSVERILISSRSGPLDLVAAKAAAGDAAARLRALPAVTKVEDPVPSPDGKLFMIPVAMAGDPDTGADRVQPLLDATAAAQKDYPALRVEEVGNASIHKALDATIGKDFQRAELFSLPVTLLILLVACGASARNGPRARGTLTRWRSRPPRPATRSWCPVSRSSSRWPGCSSPATPSSRRSRWARSSWWRCRYSGR